MKINYANNKLYIQPTPQERLDYFPMLPYIKLDKATGLMFAPTQALLSIITVVPLADLEPMNKATSELISKAMILKQSISKLKAGITDKNISMKSVEFPFLMKHQAICNSISKLRNRYAFFPDTGTR